MNTEIIKLAAFSDGERGGNPAGVWIGESLPDAAVMQQIAADVGFSETAFAVPTENGWRVRYFSPLAEVGRATRRRRVRSDAQSGTDHGGRTCSGLADVGSAAVAAHLQQANQCALAGRSSGAVRLYVQRSGSAHHAGTHQRRCRASDSSAEQSCSTEAMRYDGA